VPDRPFSLAGDGRGAWELAFRYSDIDLDDSVTPGIAAATTNGVYGGRQRAYTVWPQLVSEPGAALHAELCPR